MDSINDPKNMIGLSSLIDDDDLGSEIDLAKIEREIIQGARINNTKIVNHADEYKKEMEKISQNINFAIEKGTPKHSSNSYSIDVGYNDDEKSVASFRINTPVSRSSTPRKTFNFSEDTYSPKDSHMRNMTTEQKRQSQINKVLHQIDDKELECINSEREEDLKANILEQIDMLRMTLEDDGIEIGGVPLVHKNTPMVDIQSVYKILRLKNDRNRYCSFAEELILAGSYGLENLFDGEKVWFGSYKPDLVGWSSTVKVKLRRMRFETSTFVGEIMENYQMSAGVRLLLELIPSLFLYSRSKKITHNDNLVSDKDYKDAISQLNNI